MALRWTAAVMNEAKKGFRRLKACKQLPALRVALAPRPGALCWTISSSAGIRKWRLKHRAVADSPEEAGKRLFTFTRLPPSQWRSLRTTNAIERLHEAFKRRIKTQTVLPSADTATMLFWALLASGQINMRKVDDWQTLVTKPIDQPIDLAA
jgi:transposase-like protein